MRSVAWATMASWEQRILTVEDDERIRTAVKLALEDEGWVGRGGRHRRGRARRRSPVTPADVVLIDIMLPGIDGFEVCRSIRRAERRPDRHGHRPSRHPRRGGRARGRRRRLPHQAVRPEGAVGPHPGAAAPGPHRRPGGHPPPVRRPRDRPRRGRRAPRRRRGAPHQDRVPAPRRARRQPGPGASAARSCSSGSGATATSATAAWSTCTSVGSARRSRPTRPTRATSSPCGASATSCRADARGRRRARSPTSRPSGTVCASDFAPASPWRSCS